MKLISMVVTVTAIVVLFVGNAHSYNTTSNPNQSENTIERTFVGCNDLGMTMELRRVSIQGNEALKKQMAENHSQTPGVCRGFIVSVNWYSAKLCEDYQTRFEDCSVSIKIEDEIWFIVLPAFAEPE